MRSGRWRTTRRRASTERPHAAGAAWQHLHVTPQCSRAVPREPLLALSGCDAGCGGGPVLVAAGERAGAAPARGLAAARGQRIPARPPPAHKGSLHLRLPCPPHPSS
ncbi:uncharacterized protein CC84DRAFT_242945 [Paraphaeosphaeria sporulosa]|uniref:Uncharacterized protein n=1 Tax=Paraphaeosphaeria sporulosa TaxID=1460663 RepID=A0A177C021_9PLEO|nr:uncharacterized protein CC84DRAFT_242945 [Paraphaeosphaeria sporulosa]OAG00756.1 hypothetical protein CC84DRAFT_242945 [Paraphaeosphaeria sporulosa]